MLDSVRRRAQPPMAAGLRFPVSAVVFLIVLASANRAGNTAAANVSDHDLQAKLSYCETCHGQSGRGFHGYYPIPRLAGQQPEYIQNQLQAFIEQRRTSNIMKNVAHVLSPPMVAALAAKFEALNPPPLGD